MWGVKCIQMWDQSQIWSTANNFVLHSTDADHITSFKSWRNITVSTSCSSSCRKQPTAMIEESESIPRYMSLSTARRGQNREPTTVVPDTSMSGCVTSSPLLLPTTQQPAWPSGCAQTLTVSPSLTTEFILYNITALLRCPLYYNWNKGCKL